MTGPRLPDYLAHIVDAIDRINRYVDGLDRAGFGDDELVQDAVVRNFEIVGEASRRIRLGHPEFAAKHPELPFASAYQMRNAISHGYFALDLDLVWSTIVTDLPKLREQVLQVLTETELE